MPSLDRIFAGCVQSPAPTVLPHALGMDGQCAQGHVLVFRRKRDLVDGGHLDGRYLARRSRLQLDSPGELPPPRIHEIERGQLREPVGLQAQVVQGCEVAGAESLLDLPTQGGGEALGRWQANPAEVLRLEA